MSGLASTPVRSASTLTSGLESLYPSATPVRSASTLTSGLAFLHPSGLVSTHVCLASLHPSGPVSTLVALGSPHHAPRRGTEAPAPTRVDCTRPTWTISNWRPLQPTTNGSTDG
jgi:hypothetical protein